MAKILIFTESDQDSLDVKAQLVLSKTAFTEIRVDQVNGRDLPDPKIPTAELGSTELKAMIYEMWLNLRRLMP